MTRAGDPDDTETYAYNGDGERIRKRRTRRVSGRDVVDEVRYLPGLEIRSNGATGERLHVIQGQAEAAGVHVLHWPGTPPDGLANDAPRYSLTDHLNSCAMELDGHAASISLERYYPFGGTSFTATRHALEADYRTIRYAGKERDASGLYYYGSRYYAPWMHRWTQPDPAGIADGLNRYVFVHDDPVNHVAVQGQVAVTLDGVATWSSHPPSNAIHLTDHPAMPRSALSVSGTSVTVDASTFDLLALADRAIHMAKSIFAYGAHNQEIDIVRSNGQSVVRLGSREDRSLETFIRTGTGNCGEHADLAFFLLSMKPLKVPLMVTKAINVDHAFATLGDYRETPAPQIVVADPWVTLPMAHLLSEGGFSAGEMVKSLPPGQFLTSPIDSSWITELPAYLGTGLADTILEQQWNNGSTYTDGFRFARYDIFPQHRLDEHVRLQNHVRSLRERRGPLPSEAHRMARLRWPARYDPPERHI